MSPGIVGARTCLIKCTVAGIPGETTEFIDQLLVTESSDRPADRLLAIATCVSWIASS